MMQLNFFNTNHETGKVLESSRELARTQQAIVLKWFEEHPGEYFSREEINNKVLTWVLLTSVQRCLSNLTRMGKLQKTHNFAKSRYGKNVHTWTLATDEVVNDG